MKRLQIPLHHRMISKGDKLALQLLQSQNAK